MTLRAKTAVVGIGEIPTRRVHPNRTLFGLLADAAREAIEDAGLRKGDIDGLITEGGPVPPAALAEYLGIRPTFATGLSMAGSSGAVGTTVAAAAINAGLCTNVLVVLGRSRETQQQTGRVPGTATEFEAIYGPAQGAGTGYAMLYKRHMHEFGTTPQQMAKLAANQRFNALNNPNSVFQGESITPQDVLDSRYINEPLHILECVMPCDGAAAAIITSAEHAKSLPNKPVLILGSGIEQGTAVLWQTNRLTTTPVAVSAPRAFAMAGYGPQDMQFAEFYDCYTILEAVSLEDAGFVKKGEIGPFFDSTDTTYKGSFPINTDGGQLSGGQPGLAGGFRHVIEGVRQIMGRAGDRQVLKNDLCMVNG